MYTYTAHKRAAVACRSANCLLADLMLVTPWRGCACVVHVHVHVHVHVNAYVGHASEGICQVQAEPGDRAERREQYGEEQAELERVQVLQHVLRSECVCASQCSTPRGEAERAAGEQGKIGSGWRGWLWMARRALDGEACHS